MRRGIGDDTHHCDGVISSHTASLVNNWGATTGGLPRNCPIDTPGLDMTSPSCHTYDPKYLIKIILVVLYTISNHCDADPCGVETEVTILVG